jgi:hypothetical protein
MRQQGTRACASAAVSKWPARQDHKAGLLTDEKRETAISFYESTYTQLGALLGEPPDAPLDFAPAIDLATGNGRSLAR